MSCQDPTLRVIECVQHMLLSPSTRWTGEGHDSFVCSRHLENLRQAYAEYLTAKRAEG